MRVDRRVVDTYLVVQMRACGAPAMTYVADHLATDHLLACDHRKARHVPVDSLNPVTVVDDDLAAITVSHFGRLHDAVASGANGKPVRRADVDTGMELALAIAQDRVFALTKAAGDWPHDGPQRRNIRGSILIAARTEQVGRTISSGAKAGEGPGRTPAQRRVAKSVKSVNRFVIRVFGQVVCGVSQRCGGNGFSNACRFGMVLVRKPH